MHAAKLQLMLARGDMAKAFWLQPWFINPLTSAQVGCFLHPMRMPNPLEIPSVRGHVSGVLFIWIEAKAGFCSYANLSAGGRLYSELEGMQVKAYNWSAAAIHVIPNKYTSNLPLNTGP